MPADECLMAEIAPFDFARPFRTPNCELRTPNSPQPTAAEVISQQLRCKLRSTIVRPLDRGFRNHHARCSMKRTFPVLFQHVSSALALLALILVSGSGPARADDEPGFKSLFNGKDLS